MYYDIQKSAERIKNLRADRHLTQNEAAKRMGFSLSGYRKLEQGQNGGSVDSLVIVAEFYQVSLDYLICGKEEGYLSDLLDKLTESQKSIVWATMADLAENLIKFQRSDRLTGTK